MACGLSWLTTREVVFEAWLEVAKVGREEVAGREGRWVRGRGRSESARDGIDSQAKLFTNRPVCEDDLTPRVTLQLSEWMTPD